MDELKSRLLKVIKDSKKLSGYTLDVNVDEKIGEIQRLFTEIVGNRRYESTNYDNAYMDLKNSFSGVMYKKEEILKRISEINIDTVDFDDSEKEGTKELSMLLKYYNELVSRERELEL